MLTADGKICVPLGCFPALGLLNTERRCMSDPRGTMMHKIKDSLTQGTDR